MSILFLLGELVFFLWHIEATRAAEPMFLIVILFLMPVGSFALAAFAVYLQRPLFAAITRDAYERGEYLDYKFGWKVFSWLLKVDRRGNYIN